VRVALFAFDLLYLNGQSLIKEPFRSRREKLHRSCVPTEGQLHFAVSSDVSASCPVFSLLFWVGLGLCVNWCRSGCLGGGGSSSSSGLRGSVSRQPGMPVPCA
jgi:hypothetical protein